jgi:hypothetical protein
MTLHQSNFDWYTDPVLKVSYMNMERRAEIWAIREIRQYNSILLYNFLEK